MSPVAEVGCSQIGTLNKAIFSPDICMKRRHEERWGQIRDGLAAANLHACRSSPVIFSSITPAVSGPWCLSLASWPASFSWIRCHISLQCQHVSRWGQGKLEHCDVMSFSDDLTTAGPSWEEAQQGEGRPGEEKVSRGDLARFLFLAGPAQLDHDLHVTSTQTLLPAPHV